MGQRSCDAGCQSLASVVTARPAPRHDDDARSRPHPHRLNVAPVVPIWQALKNRFNSEVRKQERAKQRAVRDAAAAEEKARREEEKAKEGAASGGGSGGGKRKSGGGGGGAKRRKSGGEREQLVRSGATSDRRVAVTHCTHAVALHPHSCRCTRPPPYAVTTYCGANVPSTPTNDFYVRYNFSSVASVTSAAFITSVTSSR